jgi:hypothetical protein
MSKADPTMRYKADTTEAVKAVACAIRVDRNLEHLEA